MTMDSSANSTVINLLSTINYATLVNTENVLETFSKNISSTSVWFIANATNVPRTQSVFESQLMVPLYIIIFILSVLGNVLVLFTLIRNKRMRTVTNVYLLNLAVADLLLGVFCMPFTLVGQVLRNFIFGATMCKLIPYFQAVSVSVAVWTLVAISLERYFAICRPLKSRRWQTRNHASKMIAFVWVASLIWSGPIMIVSTLQLSKRGHKCRESWPSTSSEQMFNLFLDVILLLIPLGIMSMAYFMIMEKLWRGLQREIEHNSCQKLVIQRSTSSPNLRSQVIKTKNLLIYSENGNTTTIERNGNKQCSQCKLSNIKGLQDKKRGTNCNLCFIKGYMQLPTEQGSAVQSEVYTHSEDSTRLKESIVKETTYTFARHGIRSNYMDRSIEAKRKVIRMLFVIVAEFFICWAPIHILNTWYLFYPKEVYEIVGSTGVSLVQLLAYISSCSNPITYCFMNRKFRQTFFTAFKCGRPCLYKIPVSNNDTRHRNIVLKKPGNNSENSCNDSTMCVGRISYTGRSGAFTMGTPRGLRTTILGHYAALPKVIALDFTHYGMTYPLGSAYRPPYPTRYPMSSGQGTGVNGNQKPRIVFSSASDIGRASTPSGNPTLAVIEIDPEDASFRYKISWVKNQHGAQNGVTKIQTQF